MTHHDATGTLCEISALDAAQIVGGAAPKLDFNAIRQQAQQYCPATAAKYAGVNPAQVNRGTATQMGNACLSEMGGFKAMFARGPMTDAINQAFPR